MSHRHRWVCEECGNRRPAPTDPVKAREQLYAWRLANPDRMKAIHRRYEEANPHVGLVGEKNARVRALPEQLRPVALMIRETRQQIKAATGGGRGGRT